jgi:hypothetical protein
LVDGGCYPSLFLNAAATFVLSVRDTKVGRMGRAGFDKGTLAMPLIGL